MNRFQGQLKREFWLVCDYFNSSNLSHSFYSLSFSLPLSPGRRQLVETSWREGGLRVRKVGGIQMETDTNILNSSVHNEWMGISKDWTVSVGLSRERGRGRERERMRVDMDRRTDCNRISRLELNLTRVYVSSGCGVIIRFPAFSLTLQQSKPEASGIFWKSVKSDNDTGVQWSKSWTS